MTPGSERCDVTDLLADQCAHCRKAAAPTNAGPVFRAPASGGEQFGPVIGAMYPGQCAGCLDRVDEGDRIRHSTPHGGFIHEGCEDE